MLKLYEFPNEYQEAMEIEDETKRIKRMDELQLQANTKIDNITKFIRNLEGNVEIVNNEILRLENLKSQLENKKEWLKKYVLFFMEMNSITKIKTDLFSISIAKNPPAIIITDEEKIPAEFKRTKTITEVDKVLIKSVIQDGMSVAGAELKQGTHLVIK